ncbi:MAG: hypothetical protein JO021_08565 [Alphaproteobacteria bacterium]|nr:hypothetical protein [Alphaproteobacteria bacterium]
MVDVTAVAISNLRAPPPVGAADPLDAPRAQPTPDADRFGPAVVIGPSMQPPALVLYDSQGRLTASVPSDTAAAVMPPARIDVGPSEAAASLVYAG